MNKKFLTSILLLTVILFCSVTCFASNDNLGTEVQDSANKSGDTLQEAGDGIRNIASDIGNGVEDAAHDIGQGVEDVFQGTDGAVTNSGNEAVGSGTGMTSSDYTATRTATDGMGSVGMTNTAWVWLILGVVGIVIVALTWYYVTQNSDNNNRH